MTKMLDIAIQQAKALPEERQNDLGAIMLTLVEWEIPLPTIPF
jgi:hypothetical protein